MRALASVAALLVSVLPYAPAHAAPDPVGDRCNLAGYTDPVATGADDHWTMWAGPLALVDDAAPATVLSGRVRCEVREGFAHTGQLLVAADGPVTPAVVVLPPTTVTFTLPGPVDFSVCTEVELTDGRVLYWDDDAQGWSTDPDVTCLSLVGHPLPVPWDLVDALVCPVLAQVYPPDGDVPGLWDCPPA